MYRLSTPVNKTNPVRGFTLLLTYGNFCHDFHRLKNSSLLVQIFFLFSFFSPLFFLSGSVRNLYKSVPPPLCFLIFMNIRLETKFERLTLPLPPSSPLSSPAWFQTHDFISIYGSHITGWNDIFLEGTRERERARGKSHSDRSWMKMLKRASFGRDRRAAVARKDTLGYGNNNRQNIRRFIRRMRGCEHDFVGCRLATCGSTNAICHWHFELNSSRITLMLEKKNKKKKERKKEYIFAKINSISMRVYIYIYFR